MADRDRLAPVVTPEVGGVRIRRPVLEAETASMLQLVRRVRRRLLHWMRTMPEERSAVRRTEHGWEPILNADGQIVTQPLIPDQEWRESAEWVSKTLLGLLKEQRERAKLRPGGGAAAVDDATFDAELKELARAAIAEMSDDELRLALAARTAIDVVLVDAEPVGVVTSPHDELEI